MSAESSFMKPSNFIMDALEPGIILELRMEILLLAAMIGFAAMLNRWPPRVQVYNSARWRAIGQPRQINKDRSGRPGSHDKYDTGTHPLFDNMANREQKASMEHKNVLRLCLCMKTEKIKEVGPLAFNCHGKEHEALKWDKVPPTVSSFLKDGSKRGGNPVVRGASLTAGTAQQNLKLFDALCSRLEGEELAISESAHITKHNALNFYNTLVKSCVKMNKNDKVSEILTHMAMHKIPKTIGFCEGVLKQLAGIRWFKEALHVYPILTSDGLEPSPVMCSCMVSFAADCGEHELAKHFYSHLCSLTTPNLRTCVTMLQVHKKQGGWQAALAVYWHMQACKANIDKHVLNMVMMTCAVAGKVNEVEQLLADAETGVSEFVLPDIVSYNTVMKAYATRGDYRNAGKVLMRMRKRGLEPNAITYNTLIDAAALTGEAVAAWEFYQDMIRFGFPGDKYTCSILIKTLSPNPTGDRIRKCLDLLREVGNACDLKLRSRLYHNIIEAALQLGDSTVLIRSFAQTRLHRVRPTAESCRQLKELAVQCKGARGKALEAALSDGGAAVGFALEEKQAAGQETPPAVHDPDDSQAGEMPMKPPAPPKPQATQRHLLGSTSDEPN
mmetsp:Transcript_117026/g.233205  ORF Transcript_117026/g.233205 Transcript_117026/m.233205 type:complete len:613 (-) Transcript_117026:188-2026(-)